MAVVTERNARIVAVVFCGLLVILGLIIIIPLSLISSSTGGQCLLYADSGSYGSDSVCAYPVAVAAIFQLICCLARAVFVVLGLIGIAGKEYPKHNVFLIACAVVDVIACVLTLISSGIISQGFSVMCSEIFHPHSDRCGELDIYNAATNSFLKGYYQRLNIAEAGAWISWACWIVLIVVDIFLLWKADMLPGLPFSLPGCPVRCPRRDTRNNATRDPDSDTRVSDMEIEQPGRVAVTYNMQAHGGGSLPRTPPPKRPVPPRPESPAGRALMTRY